MEREIKIAQGGPKNSESEEIRMGHKIQERQKQGEIKMGGEATKQEAVKWMKRKKNEVHTIGRPHDT